MSEPTRLLSTLREALADTHSQVEYLARGGMSVLFKAYHTGLKQWQAIKVLGGTAAVLSEEGVRRFREEAVKIAQLRHPHIRQVHDIRELPGQELVYMIIEYIDGVSLDKRLKQGPLEMSHGLRVARHTAEALAHAHAHGIVHRDIKPGNILLDAEGTAYLADFGIAKAEDDPDLTRDSIPGTELYLAPELFDRQAADVRSDLFALGCLFYAMFVGRQPFAYGGESLHARLAAGADVGFVRPAAVLATVPPALDDLLVRLVSPDPEARPEACDEVAHALAAILEEFESGVPTSDALSITLEADTKALDVGASAHLRVFAHQADGSRQDVTRDAQYSWSPSESATLDAGVLVGTRPGSVRVHVRYRAIEASLDVEVHAPPPPAVSEEPPVHGASVPDHGARPRRGMRRRVLAIGVPLVVLGGAFLLSRLIGGEEASTTADPDAPVAAPAAGDNGPPERPADTRREIRLDLLIDGPQEALTVRVNGALQPLSPKGAVVLRAEVGDLLNVEVEGPGGTYRSANPAVRVVADVSEYQVVFRAVPEDPVPPPPIAREVEIAVTVTGLRGAGGREPQIYLGGKPTERTVPQRILVTAQDGDTLRVGLRKYGYSYESTTPFVVVTAGRNAYEVTFNGRRSP